MRFGSDKIVCNCTGLCTGVLNISIVVPQVTSDLFPSKFSFKPIEQFATEHGIVIGNE